MKTKKQWSKTCGTGKSSLRGKFIAIQPYLRKQEKNLTNLTLHQKQLEKEQTKSRVRKKS